MTPPPPPFSVGIGFDMHRLVSGRRLVLGGVEIQHALGLLGHSDADVLIHAVCDALLGAAALGDIGCLFPDTDAAHKDRDSGEFLKIVCDHVRRAGWQVGNVDAVLICQQPKISPHYAAMRRNLAALIGVEDARVGIKASTSEGLDDAGKGLGIACHAVALLYR